LSMAAPSPAHTAASNQRQYHNTTDRRSFGRTKPTPHFGETKLTQARNGPAPFWWIEAIRYFGETNPTSSGRSTPHRNPKRRPTLPPPPECPFRIPHPPHEEIRTLFRESALHLRRGPAPPRIFVLRPRLAAASSRAGRTTHTRAQP